MGNGATPNGNPGSGKEKILNDFLLRVPSFATLAGVAGIVFYAGALLKDLSAEDRANALAIAQLKAFAETEITRLRHDFDLRESRMDPLTHEFFAFKARMEEVERTFREEITRIRETIGALRELIADGERGPTASGPYSGGRRLE